MTVTATVESVRPVGWWAVLEERTRLRAEDGLTDEKVDQLTSGQLHAAAQCYLLSTDDRPGGKPWPSIGLAWRPGDRAVHLARAGALYLARTVRRLAVAEGLSKLIDRGPIPAQREDPRP